MNWTTILVPTDFSDASRAALAVATDLCRIHGARLVLAHVVVSALPALLPDVAGFRYDEIADALGERAQASLPEFFPEAERGAIPVSFRIAHGVPHQEICRLAEEERADLIVIATHGRSAALHLLLGSVTDKVVRRACCPVLVVRPATG